MLSDDKDKLERYKRLGHAIQTGIAWNIALENPDCANINMNSNLCAHKHLRTGIDLTKSDHGALVKLLVDKGIINDEEYFDAILEGLEREKQLYEQTLSLKLGKNITLA